MKRLRGISRAASCGRRLRFLAVEPEGDIRLETPRSFAKRFSAEDLARIGTHLAGSD